MFLNTAWAFYDRLQKLHFTYACPQRPKGSQRPAKAHRGNRAPQRPSRDPTEAQQRPTVAHRVTCSHVQKSHFTCFCVYLRSRAGCQKSRYAVYTCFYVFQGSLCVVYTCFYVFFDPQSSPLSPQRPNRSPTGTQKGPQSPQEAPQRPPQSSPDSPQRPPEAQRRPTDAQQRPEKAHSGQHSPIKAARVRIYTGFHVFSRVYSRSPWVLPGLSLYVFLRVFLRPMCNLHGFLRYFGPGSGRPRTCPDVSGRPRRISQRPEPY